MTINIANYMNADRRSAIAGEAMDQGMVCVVSDDGAGQRRLMKLTEVADLTAGKYGIAYKVSVDPFQVDGSTAPSFTGNRVVTISSGDNVVEISRKAIIEYSADLLDASLDPARSGTTPSVGDDLKVVSSRFCASGAQNALATVVAKVFRVHGTKVLVELL